MAKKVPKTKSAKQAKMKKVMDEWKAGSLRSGSKQGPKVTSQQQAIAIGLSQSGQSNKGIKRKKRKESKVGRALS